MNEKKYVMFVERSKMYASNMHTYYEFLEGWGLTEDGDIDEISDRDLIFRYKRAYERENGKLLEGWYNTWSCTDCIALSADVRDDHVDLFKSLSCRGRSKRKVMELMSEAIKENAK